MAAGRKSKARIGIAIHRGKIRPRAQLGWLDVDNTAAVILIVIIVAARMIAVLAKIAYPILRILAVWIMRQLTALVLFLHFHYIGAGKVPHGEQ